MQFSVSTLPRWIAMSLAALAATGARAEANPYQFQIEQTLGYDSNIRRVNVAPARDAISTTSLTAGIDQPYGRQRYLGSATVEQVIYKNNDQYNNTAYNALLGMDWSAAAHWSGDARATTQQSLASFDSFGTVGNRPKVLQNVNAASFRARYGLASPWAVEAIVAHRDVHYNNTLLDYQEYHLNSGSLGALYQPTDLSNFGVAARFTSGAYPKYTPTIEDGYTRRDIDFTAQLKPSGLSTINARISATSEDHDVNARDFSGVTGEVGWIYAATGKTTFGATLKRDTGINGGTPGAEGQATYLTPNRVTNSLVLNARWDATGKIQVNANLGYSRDKYDGTVSNGVGGTNSASQTGNSYSAKLAVNYAATRAWLITCSAGRQERSNVDVNGAPLGYKANTAECSVRLTLQ